MSFPVFLQQSSCFLLPSPWLNTTVTHPPRFNHQAQNSRDLRHDLFLCIYIYKVKLGWRLDDSGGDHYFFISHRVLLAVFGSNLLISLNQFQSRGKKRVLFKVKGNRIQPQEKKILQSKNPNKKPNKLSWTTNLHLGQGVPWLWPMVFWIWLVNGTCRHSCLLFVCFQFNHGAI